MRHIFLKKWFLPLKQGSLGRDRRKGRTGRRVWSRGNHGSRSTWLQVVWGQLGGGARFPLQAPLPTQGIHALSRTSEQQIGHRSRPRVEQREYPLNSFHSLPGHLQHQRTPIFSSPCPFYLESWRQKLHLTLKLSVSLNFCSCFRVGWGRKYSLKMRNWGGKCTGSPTSLRHSLAQEQFQREWSWSWEYKGESKKAGELNGCLIWRLYIYAMSHSLCLRKMEKWGGLKQESGIIRLKFYKDHTGCCMTGKSGKPNWRQEHLLGS